MKVEYYNPEKILSLLDLEKLEPSIYLISTNRSAGKTTAFLKKSLEHYKETGRKTVLLYRYQYELNSAYLVYSDVMNMYPDLAGDLTTVAIAKGLFYEIFFNGESFGYALSMNNPDSMKKYSPLFSEVDYIIFDEFQTETGKYLNKEVEKFQSLFLTIARGGGEQSRNVKVFMLSNLVSIMNPYYITFGIHKRLKSDTKFMRGIGWVAEFGYNESAAISIKNNGVGRAFSDSEYIKYSTQKSFLKQTDSFISKVSGKSKYMFTFIYDGCNYGVRDCFEDGFLYVSKKIDSTCKSVIAFKPSDHNQNTMMLSHYSYLWKNIKEAYYNGCLRFDDVKTKNAVFDILAIDIYK